MANVDPRFLSIGLQLLPDAIKWFREAFAKEDPDAPVLTDIDVLEILNQSTESTLAHDAEWLAAHPPEDDPPSDDE